MPYRPDVGDRLSIDGVTYSFTQHPAAPGMPFGQAGRRATVYQLAQVDDADLRALKVFTTTFRTPRVAEGASRLSPYSVLPGLQVCTRTVLTPERHAEILAGQPDLTYAVLMPWIDGLTWQEIVLERQPLARELCLALARSLAHVLARMEAQGLAHCDLSSPNVLLNLDRPEVMLVDVEDLYATDLPRPEKLPAGSAGYAHRTAPAGLWSADADRFAGAVLIAEMLVWCDARAVKSAVGEQYFEPEELQQDGRRYRAISAALREQWGAASADLFVRAWRSGTLLECPRLEEWASLLAGLQRPVAEGAAPIPSVLPSDTERERRETAGRLLQRALGLLEHQDKDGALAVVREAYAHAPDDAAETYARVLLARGGAKARANDWPGALQDYQEAHRIAPPGGLRDELAIIIANGPVAEPPHCAACGRPARPDWKRCPYCGAALAADADDRGAPPNTTTNSALSDAPSIRAKPPGRLLPFAAPACLLLIVLAVVGAHTVGQASVTAAPLGTPTITGVATSDTMSLFAVAAALSTPSSAPAVAPITVAATPTTAPTSTPTALPSATATTAPTAVPTATTLPTATAVPMVIAVAPPPALDAARYLQTATRLANGKVLVAGGEDSHGALATAELYDPATNQWSSAGRMTTPRFHHTATLLRSGKVLVVGGQDSVTGYLASAELYDPATNAWSSAGKMTMVRSQHTATLLIDGQVLVVGGWDGLNYLNSAERYDPTTNRWTSAGAMAVTRYDHTATLLRDGRVLIVGGFGTAAENSAELYDPSKNTWSAAPPMAHGRIGHTATLLPNGQVLVAGGISSSLGGSYPAGAERYDPKANRWSPAGSLADGRVGHTATLLPDGRVLIVAGKDGNGLLATAELYDPASNTWSAAGTLARPTWLQAAALLPDGALVTGGRDANNALTLVERFDQRTNTWSVAR